MTIEQKQKILIHIIKYPSDQKLTTPSGDLDLIRKTVKTVSIDNIGVLIEGVLLGSDLLTTDLREIASKLVKRDFKNRTLQLQVRNLSLTVFSLFKCITDKIRFYSKQPKKSSEYAQKRINQIVKQLNERLPEHNIRCFFNLLLKLHEEIVTSKKEYITLPRIMIKEACRVSNRSYLGWRDSEKNASPDFIPLPPQNYTPLQTQYLPPQPHFFPLQPHFAPPHTHFAPLQTHCLPPQPYNRPLIQRLQLQVTDNPELWAAALNFRQYELKIINTLDLLNKLDDNHCRQKTLLTKLVYEREVILWLVNKIASQMCNTRTYLTVVTNTLLLLKENQNLKIQAQQLFPRLHLIFTLPNAIQLFSIENGYRTYMALYNEVGLDIMESIIQPTRSQHKKIRNSIRNIQNGRESRCLVLVMQFIMTCYSPLLNATTSQLFSLKNTRGPRSHHRALNIGCIFAAIFSKKRDSNTLIKAIGQEYPNPDKKSAALKLIKFTLNMYRKIIMNDKTRTKKDNQIQQVINAVNQSITEAETVTPIVFREKYKEDYGNYNPAVISSIEKLLLTG